MKSLIPVILCGGSGTRLWPLSRETYPKQFLSLLGQRSMLQDTAIRLNGLNNGLVKIEAPIVICNQESRFLVASQLQEIKISHGGILLEPAGRNTAPALTLAAIQATSAGNDPILLAMPADHVITDVAAMLKAVEQGLTDAAAGAMVTFGIVADRAETGYGYIKRGSAQANGSFEIAGFTEKPDPQTAQKYLESGQYDWNSGLFMLKASVWLKAIEACRPDIFRACQTAMQDSTKDVDFIRPDGDAFLGCPSDSIDYAVMEKLPVQPELGIAARVVPMQAGWSDLGAWDALWELLPRDDCGNASTGNTMAHDCHDSMLISSERLVVGIGLNNMVVVETPDAVLVVDKSKTQEVKTVVARLRAEGHAIADRHRKVHRPWGWYDSIDQGDRFQAKRIVVNPGASLSLQLHHHRAEHWIVVQGTAKVTNGDQVIILGENQSTYIPLGHKHRLENPGRIPLEIIEVQSGSYLGEDDIVRFDDVYGRN
jgi:mannose-1-phosphate guanylyltransferase/mannose-6-phosphate isomerase